MLNLITAMSTDAVQVTLQINQRAKALKCLCVPSANSVITVVLDVPNEMTISDKSHSCRNRLRYSYCVWY